MPTYTATVPLAGPLADRQIGLDVPNLQGVSGELLLTVDRRLWDEDLGNPTAGIRVQIVLTPLGEDGDELPEGEDR